MTDTTDIKALSDRLRALTKTRTPGKWWIDSHGEALVAFTDGGIVTVLKPEHLREKAHRDENTGNLSYWPNDSDASWIAATQPQNIIAILDQLEAERHKGDLWFGKVADLEAALKAECQRTEKARETLGLDVAWQQRALVAEAELAAMKAKLANPVVLPKYTGDLNYEVAFLRGVEATAKKIHAAGFTTTLRGE